MATLDGVARRTSDNGGVLPPRNGSEVNNPGQDLLKRLLAGDRVAVARGISTVENDDADAIELLKAIYSHTGKAYRVGITGPPGAGKSTITNKLAKLYRTQNKRVGIIAVDPTSPFTGGALLGDRIRMTDVELDTGVFIRSMASRRATAVR